MHLLRRASRERAMRHYSIDLHGTSGKIRMNAGYDLSTNEQSRVYTLPTNITWLVQHLQKPRMYMLEIAISQH